MNVAVFSKWKVNSDQLWPSRCSVRIAVVIRRCAAFVGSFVGSWWYPTRCLSRCKACIYSLSYWWCIFLHDLGRGLIVTFCTLGAPTCDCGCLCRLASSIRLCKSTGQMGNIFFCLASLICLLYTVGRYLFTRALGWPLSFLPNSSSRHINIWTQPDRNKVLCHYPFVIHERIYVPTYSVII